MVDGLAEGPGGQPPETTVVVVAYNNAGDVDACVRSVIETTETGWAEVVVVDNASTDGTLQQLRHLEIEFPQVVVVANTVNRGFAAACNAGARHGTGRVVTLLNPDTVTHANCMQALVALADRPGVGPAGGRTVDADGALDRRSVQRGPELRELLSWSVLLATWGRRVPGPVGRWLGRHRALLPTDCFGYEHPVPVVIGCLLALRRTEWDRLGGFDETYFMYGEDVDLSLRARAIGLTPTYTPDAVITHFVGKSSTRAEKLTMSMRGRVTVLLRHWSRPRASAGRCLLLAGVGARAAVERLGGRPGPWTAVLRARHEWLRGWPTPVRSSLS